MRKPGFLYITAILWLIAFSVYGLINFAVTRDYAFAATSITFLFVATIIAIVYYFRFRR